MYIFTLYRTSVIIQLWRYRDTTATITISFCCCCCNCCHYCYLGMMTGTACDNDTIKGILTCVSPHWYWRVSLWNIPVPTDTQIVSPCTYRYPDWVSSCIYRYRLSFPVSTDTQIESLPVPTDTVSDWVYPCTYRYRLRLSLSLYLKTIVFDYTKCILFGSILSESMKATLCAIQYTNRIQRSTVYSTPGESSVEH